MSQVNEDGYLDLQSETERLLITIISRINEILLEFKCRIIFKDLSDSVNCFLEQKTAFIEFNLNIEDMQISKGTKNQFTTIKITLGISNLSYPFILFVPSDEIDIDMQSQLNRALKAFWKRNDKSIDKPRYKSKEFTDEEVIEYFTLIKSHETKFQRELKFVLLYSLMKDFNKTNEFINAIKTTYLENRETQKESN